jgi:hypothetical protein
VEQTEIILEILLAVNSNDIHILFKKYSSKEVGKNWSHQRGKTRMKEGRKKEAMK